MPLRDMTLGQLAEKLGKYKAFVATVGAVLLIVLVLPGHPGRGAAAAGAGGLTTVNGDVAGSPSGAVGAVSGAAASQTAAATGGSSSAPPAQVTQGANPGSIAGGAGASKATTGQSAAVQGPEVVPAGKYGASSVGTQAALSAPNCDPATGLLRMPTIYAPPCVAPFPPGATNGGSTAQGVTGNAIKIVLYLPANGAETTALNGVGLTESASDQEAQVNGVVHLFEHHVELYGRKIQIVPVTSSVADTGSAATAEARADAIQVATQTKPFLSFGVGPVSPDYDLDLAQRGVVDFSLYSWDDSLLQQTGPYLWAQYDNQHVFMALAAYIGRQLWGHNAEFAGSPVYTGSTRKIGLVYGTATLTPADVSQFTATAAQYGVQFADTIGIDDSDPTASAQQAQTAITKLQTDGVTSVLPLGSLYALLALGPAATKQGYLPEWIVNPYGFADADQVAELMDPTQWKHAFGMTSVYPVINPIQADQNGVGLWEWQYHSDPPGTFTYAGLTMMIMEKIVSALELAGPDLTPVTFRAGMFDNPPHGGAFIGGGATMGIGYGSPDHLWSTPDYSGIDDYTEIYWDGSATCTSQDGKSQNGCYYYVNNGRRYLWNQWPAGEPSLFKHLPTDITGYSGGDPPNERAPSYPEQNTY